MFASRRRRSDDSPGEDSDAVPELPSELESSSASSSSSEGGDTVDEEDGEDDEVDDDEDDDDDSRSSSRSSDDDGGEDDPRALLGRMQLRAMKRAAKVARDAGRPGGARPAGTHSGVTCDGCSIRDFPGARFKCTVCFDYDLCGSCRADDVATRSHDPDHPMDLIAPPPLGGDFPFGVSATLGGPPRGMPGFMGRGGRGIRGGPRGGLSRGGFGGPPAGLMRPRMPGGRGASLYSPFGNGTPDPAMFEAMAAASQDAGFRFTSTSASTSGSLTCPVCYESVPGGESMFVDHVMGLHGDSPRPGTCPICATRPGGDPNYVSQNVVSHIRLRHGGRKSRGKEPMRIRRAPGDFSSEPDGERELMKSLMMQERERRVGTKKASRGRKEDKVDQKKPEPHAPGFGRDEYRVATRLSMRRAQQNEARTRALGHADAVEERVKRATFLQEVLFSSAMNGALELPGSAVVVGAEGSPSDSDVGSDQDLYEDIVDYDPSERPSTVVHWGDLVGTELTDEVVADLREKRQENERVARSEARALAARMGSTGGSRTPSLRGSTTITEDLIDRELMSL
jgi:Zinc finger, ZZ type/Drought induced 19 protein (Di19), zinc-binding